jgi:hypothetical protein
MKVENSDHPASAASSARFASESALVALGLSADDAEHGGARAWSGEGMVGGHLRVFQLMARRAAGRLEAWVRSFDAKTPQEAREEARLVLDDNADGAEQALFWVDGQPASQEATLARFAACSAFARASQGCVMGLTPAGRRAL